MDLKTAINERHSVRSYIDMPIENDKVATLQARINECNRDSDLHIQLVLNEPKAFDSFMAHYGKFSGVQNYVALIGKNKKDLQEKIGYFGAKIVLYAQTLGLNTCWVAMTYKKIKNAFILNKGEKLCSVLAIGYGTTQGSSHKVKEINEVSSSKILPVPDWFTEGVKVALLAPTAINQQKFHFTYLGENKVKATTKGGFYTKMDLGIAKYFFELGAHNVQWVK